MTYLKSLKPQQVMSPASRLATCATSQQAPKNDAKDKSKKETKAVKTTKRRWREPEKRRSGKRINSPYTPSVASLQTSKRPHYRKDLLAIAKIAKINSRPPESYLFFQNFQREPP